MIPTPTSAITINDGVGNIAVEVDLENRHNAKNSSYDVDDAEGKDSAERNLAHVVAAVSRLAKTGSSQMNMSQTTL